MSIKLESPPQLDTWGPGWQRWIFGLYARVAPGPFKISGYPKAKLPSAALWGSNTIGFSSLVYVTDEVGGAVIAFSDGINWRRVTDRAIVS